MVRVDHGGHVPLLPLEDSLGLLALVERLTPPLLPALPLDPQLDVGGTPGLLPDLWYPRTPAVAARTTAANRRGEVCPGPVVRGGLAPQSGHLLLHRGRDRLF